LTEYENRGDRLSIEMKTLLVTVSLALAGVSTANAQVFRPSVGGSAVVGAVAGGLIGGHNGDRWAQGAVIGAAAGALIGAAMQPQEPVYTSAPPVYQAPVYGQQVYGQQVYSPQPGTTVVQAPTVPNAPMVQDAPTVVYQPAPQVVQTQPQVVYVESAPRVVYVPAPAPRVIYAAPPVVSFGIGIHSGSHRGHYNLGHYNRGWDRHRGHRY
jgi:hypothetical protein